MEICYVYAQQDGTPKGAIGFWDDSWWSLGASQRLGELGIFEMYDTLEGAVKDLREEVRDRGFELVISPKRTSIPDDFMDLEVISRLSYAPDDLNFAPKDTKEETDA